MRFSARRLIAALSAATLVVTGAVALSPAATAAPNDPIEIPNARLKAGINGQIGFGRHANATITEAEARSLTELSLTNVGPDISGLEHFTNLETLNLYDSEIVDIGSIAKLTRLKYLGLAGNAISDLRPLAHLSRLETLDLDRNHVFDLSPLAGLSQLSSLGAGMQSIRLDAVVAGRQFTNPVRNASGKQVMLLASTSDFRSAGTAGWSFNSAGAKSLNWWVTVDVGKVTEAAFAGSATQEVTKSASTPAPKPDTQPFPDVSSTNNVHWKNIDWLKTQGITKPVGGKYLPGSAVNRGAMATFLYRLVNPRKDAPACTSQPFPDVATTYLHCGAIKWAGRTRIAVGYTSDNTYRPNNTVTRGSMATFLYRAAGSPATPECTSKPFDDVPANSIHCKTIQWAKNNGITTGLPGGHNYGPDQVVNRDQMASFLHRIYDYLN